MTFKTKFNNSNTLFHLSYQQKNIIIKLSPRIKYNYPLYKEIKKNIFSIQINIHKIINKDLKFNCKKTISLIKNKVLIIIQT